jgi:hypothetical protein
MAKPIHEHGERPEGWIKTYELYVFLDKDSNPVYYMNASEPASLAFAMRNSLVPMYGQTRVFKSLLIVEEQDLQVESRSK